MPDRHRIDGSYKRDAQEKREAAPQAAPDQSGADFSDGYNVRSHTSSA